MSELVTEPQVYFGKLFHVILVAGVVMDTEVQRLHLGGSGRSHMIDRVGPGPGRDYFFVISRVFQQGGDCTELCRWLETKTLSSTNGEKGRKREGRRGRGREGERRLETGLPPPSG